MSVSLNSVVGFNAKARIKLHPHHLSRSDVQASVTINERLITWRRMELRMRKVESLCLSSSSSSVSSAAENDHESEEDDKAFSSSVEDSSSSPFGSGNGNGDRLAKSQSTPSRRSPLTARERLKAARVLSKYSEAKPSPSKSAMGSKVLDAIRESDRGKRRSRLPEAPTNMLDDSKRGMPKQGLTFDFPGGVDLFVILLSFVLISTIMFATTYFVWKVGAIHFNES